MPRPYPVPVTPADIARRQAMVDLSQTEQDALMARVYRDPIYADTRAALTLASDTANRINDAVCAIIEGLTAAESAQVAALLGNARTREELGYLPEYVYQFVADAANEWLGNTALEMLNRGIRPD